MGRLPIFIGIGLLIIGSAIFAVFYSTKGSHLELKGQVLKIRSGAIDDKNSAAVLDFRLENVSDIPFMVRQVKVTAEKNTDESVEGDVISKSDYKALLEFNRFLGAQYNEGLSLKDRIPPHQRVDRMVAVRFEMPEAQLESAKQLRLWIQDVDGAEFETAKPLK